LFSRDFTIADLIETENYRRPSSLLFEEGSPQRDNIEARLSLSPTDISIIEAAKNLAKNNGQVSVASADRAIVGGLQALLEGGLNINIFSPRSESLMRLSDSIDLKFLVTANVFTHLYHESSKRDNRQRFLYVAQNMEISGQGVYDIAFFVYVRDSVTGKLPKFEGVYQIPILFTKFEDGKIKQKESYVRILSNNFTALYSEQDPTALGIIGIRNPLKYYQVVELLAKRRRRQLTEKERDRTLGKVQANPLVWARIDPGLLREYDDSVPGKMAHLRVELLRYQQ
jgi:hypothetical protein